MDKNSLRRFGLAAAAVGLLLTGCRRRAPAPNAFVTATPIKHLVVIFDENESFDHYFATYPVAANPPGEPRFVAAAGTPSVNGLTPSLLAHNPNFTNRLDTGDGANPFRLDRSQAATSTQSHDYTNEQLAYDHGAADRFPDFTGRGMAGGVGAFGSPAIVMGYYDGNTVTALWNYAQHFAMSDNSYGDQYGPSTPGAINLIAGQTDGFVLAHNTDSTYFVHDGQGGLAMINDVEPAGDVCSDTLDAGSMTGQNIGDLLDAAGITWGWFQGGFDLTVRNPNGSTGCRRNTYSPVTGAFARDYFEHHEPFQYYRSTANLKHTRPSSRDAIGGGRDGANHQYDLHDFFDAVRAGNFPAVSFLKAAGFQDGHPAYSDPLDEQRFVTEVVNFVEQTADWSHSAIILLYDDSDGWYDHRMAPVQNASFDPRRDRLTAAAACGVKGRTPQLGGVAGRGPVNGRCGPGPRQPLLVISPWARQNYVDHTLITQSSVARFIEDNWLEGQRIGGGAFDSTAAALTGLFDFGGSGNAPPLFLDDSLGTPVSAPSGRLPVIAQLGRSMFFDARLSASGAMSCADCHAPDHAYGPPDAVATHPLGRSIPSLAYVDRVPAFGFGDGDGDGEGGDERALFRQVVGPAIPRREKRADRPTAPDLAVPRGGLFWDGHADRLQEQALGPLLNPAEMANPSADVLAQKLIDAGYRGPLARLFGTQTVSSPKRLVEEAMFAIARFEVDDPSFHPYSSKYDAVLLGEAKLSDAELRGLRVFENPNKGNCASCHLDRPTPDGRPPAFTDFEYEALGAPRNGALPSNRDPHRYDLGLCAAVAPTGRPSGRPSGRQYCGMFRTPSLRNVATRRAFFHNGVFHSLDQVLAFYNFRDTRPRAIYPRTAAGDVRKFDDLPADEAVNVDVIDPPFNRKAGDPPPMTDQDMRDVITFLRTLTDGYRAGREAPAAR